MDALLTSRVEDEIEQLDIIVKASEGWAKSYDKDPNSKAKLIRNEAKWTRSLRRMFREKAQIVGRAVDWDAYNHIKSLVSGSSTKVNAAYNIQTIVSGDFFDGIDSDFVKVSFDHLSTAVATGALAGETIYKIPLGLTSTSDIIQQLTTERIAFLVGKRVDKSGMLVKNPNVAYHISDQTRKDIVKSIQTSIAQGEDKKSTIERLMGVVSDPVRAEKIAQTESVNAYGNGLIKFGEQSGAVGKESQDVQAVDYCGDYAALGPVPLDFLYGDTDIAPAYHPGCRCGLRLIYQREAEKRDLQDLLN